MRGCGIGSAGGWRVIPAGNLRWPGTRLTRRRGGGRWSGSWCWQEPGIRLLNQAKNAYPTISKAWADTGFKNAAVEHGATIGIDVEVVPRNTQTRGFRVLKRRWVVERSLGWLMLHRRLARDYETLESSSAAMIHIASIDNLAKRITDETTQTWRGTY